MVRISFLPVFRFPILLLLFFTTAGCAVGHYYGSISGQVVDKETREPLEGAAVVAVYTASMASPGGSVTYDIEWQEAVTDSKGSFTLPSRTVFSPQFGLGGYDWAPKICVAKPSYGEYGYHPEATRANANGKDVFALPKLRTKEERNRWRNWEPLSVRTHLIHLQRLLNEERAFLGLGLINLEVIK